MSKVLKIRLNITDGKVLTYTLQDPISNLRQAQVETAVNNMLNDHLFLIYGYYEPESFKDAYYYETNTTYLT